uniref:F5/8 type C domain-containing protein n=1 Tax=Anabas testudineus TaxID=64144 RepID=A0A7N6FM19_ANATE
MTATLTLILLPLLLLLLLGGSIGGAQQPQAAVRHYFIATVEIGWDYIYLSDAGIQGPVIVAKAGDRVVVHFKNLASQPYSISPVGITYWKQSEGAGYDDSTAGQEKLDDAVSPGGYYEYVWDINPKDGPTINDPDCLTYSYSSQVDPVRDINSGLIGALLICKSSQCLNGKRARRNPAFVLLFTVFDETKSWYGQVGERISREKFKRSSSRKEYHTINGYINSTLPGLTMCQGRNHVFWHLIGMGTTPEIHSIKFQDHTLQVLNHRKVTMEVTPMTFITAEMRPATVGRFSISCQIHAHRYDGMNALFTVEKCPEPVTLPGPDLRKVKPNDYDSSEENSDEDKGNVFNIISVDPKKPQLQARSSRGQQFKTRYHYIAAEEVTWDYAPHLKPTDSELQSRYLPAAPHHLDYTYKKVVYVEYTDGSFTQRKNPDKSLVGPLLKGKVYDEFHITFRNLASRPFNIYPTKQDLRSMGVPPNGTFGYIWKLTTDDGPLEGDHECLTQLYQSTISPEKDLASGLVGTLLICKYTAIDTRGRLVRTSTYVHLVFAVFDENKSWYFNDNMQKSSQHNLNTTDPAFYNSNVIYSVNGIMFSGRQFVLCQTDVIFWHVANVGTQSNFLSVYFTGNPFQYQGLSQSVLTLFPMTGMTVPMETELIGKFKDSSFYVNGTSDDFGTININPRSGETRYRTYYIAAEEITWDYGIRKPHQLIKEMRRGLRKFLPEYKKVVFRAYTGEDFQRPVNRGETEEHLGILGPFIRAEINDLLTVIFKNKASRPYSFHLQGVYDRSQAAGITQTQASSAPPGAPGDPVPPGEARTYTWKIAKNQGPKKDELDCKAGAYYSTVDKEKDLHSGLIGPLVICKPGILQTYQNRVSNMQEFALLFHTFDETKSWYLEENMQRHCAPPCQINTEDPWYHESNKFAAINGYVAETLPGLLVTQHQLVRWHLLNVGRNSEYHAVHFHGSPFTIQTKQEHRMGVYNLYPGVFGTVEMRPPTVGTWLVECTIGDYQLAGMRAKLLVYSPRCVFPLGMKSGRIEDSQITASDYIGKTPRLARLDLSGHINAWMGRNKMSWIQVDLQQPTLLHGVQTQGVRSKLRDNYIIYFTVSYSLDQDTWTTYKGNSTRQSMKFNGNMDSSRVKENLFVPPFVARYVRIHPLNFVKSPALRLELLGCDLNSCSHPLGLQTRKIPDSSISASSFYSSIVHTWSPSLARLHQKGSVNAWRSKNNNPHEWLQVDLGNVKRITGVITQGARSLFTQMMVTEFSVTISHDGQSWSSVLEESSQREKIFTGNEDPDEEAFTNFDPPLFGQYLRIHPRGWINDIALRLEVLGCDTQSTL